MLFKRNFFNKKYCFPTKSKTVISFFYITCTLYIMLSCYLLLLPAADEFTFSETCLIVVLLFMFFSIIEMIIRLIYEFLIIPYLYKKQIYQSQPQNINVQPYIQHNQFTQQPTHNMQQQSINNTNIINDQTISTPEEQSFKFCSQCGTKYNITDETCPNCGLH